MSILLSRVIVDSGVVPPDGYERAPCSVDRNDRSDDGDQHDQSHLLEPLGQLEAQGVRLQVNAETYLPVDDMVILTPLPYT